MQAKITIVGLKEVLSGLQTLHSGLVDTSELVYKAGLLVEQQIKINATSSGGVHAGGYPNVRTGNLAASPITSLSSPIQAIVGISGPAQAYAAPVEFGHSIVSRFVGKYGSRQSFHTGGQARAYPFFFKSIDQARSKIDQLVDNYIKKLLGKQ